MTDEQMNPVAWQRREQYSGIPGVISPWRSVSKEEATGHFERWAGHEYRSLYTAAQMAAARIEGAKAMQEALVSQLNHYAAEYSGEARNTMRSYKEREGMIVRASTCGITAWRIGRTDPATIVKEAFGD